MPSANTSARNIRETIREEIKKRNVRQNPGENQPSRPKVHDRADKSENETNFRTAHSDKWAVEDASFIERTSGGKFRYGGMS